MRRWGSVIAGALCLLASSARADEMPEPPAPVVERTVTIRLLDPDGEPVVGVPISIRTPFHTWRGIALMETNRQREAAGEPLLQPAWSGQPPRYLTDRNGVAQARIEFFDGDWRFVASYFSFLDTIEMEKHPEYSHDRMKGYMQSLALPWGWRFNNSVDPERMTFELRLEPIAQVGVKVKAAPTVEIDNLAINLIDTSSSHPSGYLLPRDAMDRGQTLVPPMPDQGKSLERHKTLRAAPGRDHLLMVQRDRFTHLCWLISGDRVVDGADLGEFEFSLPPATGLLGVRVFPKKFDDCTGAAEPDPESEAPYCGVTLIATDGSYYINKPLAAENNYHWRVTTPGDDPLNLDVFVPPGDYYIIDDIPSTRGPRFDLLIELLRGNRPEEGEIPKVTVTAGKGPSVSMESADLHNAVLAWHERRFPKVEVPWWE